MASYNYNIFNGLCDKAKELVIDAVSADKTFQFLYTCGLDERLLDMTPIEQIFYLASQIYAERLDKKTCDSAQIYFEPQVRLSAGAKSYIVDFLVSEQYTNNGCEYLTKKIIVETDGKDWHSSIAQMNYDYNRENELKLAGYDVFRFTGSQIYNNPFGCIEKIYNYVETCDTIKEEQESPAIGDDFYDILEDCLGNKRGDKND